MGAELHVVHVSADVTNGAYFGVQVGSLPGVHKGELDRQAKALLEAETGRIKSLGSPLGGAGPMRRSSSWRRKRARISPSWVAGAGAA